MSSDIIYKSQGHYALEGLQGLLIDILTTFINIPLSNIEAETTHALAQVGTYVGADRIYIFSYDFDRQVCTNTHEWCSPGIDPQINNLQDVPLDLVKDWVSANVQGKAIHIPDVTSLPAGGLRDTLEPQGIKTLLSLPMMNDQECVGFVGFDWVNTHHDCHDAEYRILELFAVMLTNVLLRKRADRESNYLKERLSQMDKLDALGRMAGGIAHDFGNMLTVILSHSHLALKKTPEGAPLRHHLDEINKVAERSAELTRRLMAFARQQNIKPVKLDINHHITQTIPMLNHLAGRPVKIEWTPGHDVWPITIDPSQMDQVITNLIINARDAIAEKGTIKIITNNVHRAGPPDDQAVSPEAADYVQLEVRDDGCGIDSSRISLIFEPFYTTKAPGKGTGLGLPTVFGIIKQNGGFIEVISAPGQGTRMIAHFPRKRGN